ncbi:GNAT family N-acetyltransferase [Xanthomonadaceae bacterium JHOS43]|nr:GNAT family N-acetyltransferase [Xanthomonadaceae bacterium JHOS43]
MPPSVPTLSHRAPRVRSEPLSGRWTRRLLLDDGRVLWLRPIDPADAEPIRQTFPLLSPEEIRMRFLHPIKELTPDLVRRLTTIDPAHQFALVVSEPLPPGEALVGAVARLAIDVGTSRAEFAILVSHFIAGKGLGRLLMAQLIRWARLKRLDEIYGDVLDENTAMLELADSLGFQREVLPDDPGIIRVRLTLRAAGKTSPRRR